MTLAYWYLWPYACMLACFLESLNQKSLVFQSSCVLWKFSWNWGLGLHIWMGSFVCSSLFVVFVYLQGPIDLHIAGLFRGCFCSTWCALLMTPPVAISEESGNWCVGDSTQVCRWSLLLSILLVTHPLVIGMGLALGLLVSDLSWLLYGESALTSAGESDASALSSLEGRGMDTKLSVLTWGLPCRWLMAVSL